MFLYHYFEKSKGPLLSLSALPLNKATMIQNKIISERKTFAAQRNERYLPRRKELEKQIYRVDFSSVQERRYKNCFCYSTSR